MCSLSLTGGTWTLGKHDPRVQGRLATTAASGLAYWMTRPACFVALTIGSQRADVSMGACLLYAHIDGGHHLYDCKQ